MANEQTEKKMDIELENPADFTSPEELYKDLIRSIRKYHPSDDISLIEKAYKIAHEAHKDQKRKSGEPYIIHPLCVAIILADLEMDKETIASGILHDVVGYDVRRALQGVWTGGSAFGRRCYQADPAVLVEG